MSNFLAWLMRLDASMIDAVKKLLELAKELQAADGLSRQIGIAIQIIEQVSKMTPTEVDDEIVAVIRRVATDDLLDRIASLVGQFLGSGVQTLSVEAQAEEAAFFQAKGINFFQLIAAAKLIADLIKSLRGNQTT